MQPWHNKMPCLVLQANSAKDTTKTVLHNIYNMCMQIYVRVYSATFCTTELGSTLLFQSTHPQYYFKECTLYYVSHWKSSLIVCFVITVTITSSGTTTSSKKTDDVLDALWPMFHSFIGNNIQCTRTYSLRNTCFCVVVSHC